MATLHITAGNERGRQFPLTGNELRVGRGTDQDVVLTDVATSRKHFSIVKEGNGWKLQDHGSGNGTILNGQRVSTATLKDGDTIEIGQTAFRIELPAPKPVMAPSQPKPLPPQAAAMGGTPASGAMSPPPQSGGLGTGARVGLYGMMFILSAGSIGIILTRTVLAKPVVVQSDADLVFKQGLHYFAASEYDSAKTSFEEAQKKAPDSPAVKKYLALCESETRNKDKMKAGEKALNQRKYADAKAQLEAVESASVHYDNAQKLLREAKSHDNETQVASAPVPDKPEPAAPTPPTTTATEKPTKPEKGGKVAKVETGSKSTSGKEEKPTKPVAVAKPVPIPAPVEEKPEKGGAAGAADSKAAMAAYKNRDFVGAAKAYRLESMSKADGSKLIASAKQVDQIKDLIERAGNEEKSAPEKAVKTYEEAIAADQKFSKGVHAAFLKSKIGGIALLSAKTAFSNAKYEQAYTLALSAQKSGSSEASGLLKQLDQKAAEMVSKAQSMQKSNPEEAKKLARQVQKMVPSGSANFVKAYQLVNSAGAPKRDEDE